MIVDRDLLWASYPEGYLAMRGVRTGGGWQCVEVVSEGDSYRGARRITFMKLGLRDLSASLDEQSPQWCGCSQSWSPGNLFGASNSTFDRAHDAGDLLPNLDPENDPATWACALRDLAAACGFETAYHWVWELTGGGWTLSRVWVNRYSEDAIHTSRAFGMLDTNDPATALTLARADEVKR